MFIYKQLLFTENFGIRAVGCCSVLSALGHHLMQIHAGPVLLASVSVSSYVYRPYCIYVFFLGGFPYPLALQDSLSCVWGEEIYEEIPLRIEYFRVSQSVYIV